MLPLAVRAVLQYDAGDKRQADDRSISLTVERQPTQIVGIRCRRSCKEDPTISDNYHEPEASFLGGLVLAGTCPKGVKYPVVVFTQSPK